jgi:small subunit ribosomal protein S7
MSPTEENKNVQNMVSKKVNKTFLSLFEGKLFRCGKRFAAARVVLKTFRALKQEQSKPISDLVHAAILNSYPYVTLRSKKVGGSLYQIPVHLNENKQDMTAVKWLSTSCGTKLGSRFSCLKKELSAALLNDGVAVQKKKALHALAVGNRAYIKYL